MVWLVTNRKTGTASKDVNNECSADNFRNNVDVETYIIVWGKVRDKYTDFFITDFDKYTDFAPTPTMTLGPAVPMINARPLQRSR